jgi:hypothetical protein
VIFSNLDHISDEGLRNLSRRASSTYLFAGVRFWSMLAYLEDAQPESAAEEGREAANAFTSSIDMFMEIAERLDRHPEFKERLRTVDVETASRAVFVNPNREELRALQEAIKDGSISEVFRACGTGIHNFTGVIQQFRERLLSQPDAEPDFEFVHRNLVDAWTSFIAAGQYVSAACLLAARGSLVPATQERR